MYVWEWAWVRVCWSWNIRSFCLVFIIFIIIDNFYICILVYELTRVMIYKMDSYISLLNKYPHKAKPKVLSSNCLQAPSFLAIVYVARIDQNCIPIPLALWYWGRLTVLQSHSHEPSLIKCEARNTFIIYYYCFIPGCNCTSWAWMVCQYKNLGIKTYAQMAIHNHSLTFPNNHFHNKCGATWSAFSSSHLAENVCETHG